MVKQNFILDIPGKNEDKSSPFGKFVNDLSKHVVFYPGISMGSQGSFRNVVNFPSAEFIYGYGTFIETEIGRIENDSRFWIELVSKDALLNVEKLLKEYDVGFVKNTKMYSLCCDETTKLSESLFLFNYYGEKVLFVHSPEQLFSVHASAYLSDYGIKDENLELAILEYERNIKFDPNSDEEPFVSVHKIFAGVKEAEEYIQKYLEERIEDSLKGWDGSKYDVVIFIDSNSDSDEEMIFPKGYQITDDSKVVRSNIFLPKIIKTFSDGKVLTQDQTLNILPISLYFDVNMGLKHFYSICSCEKCYGDLTQKLKDEAIKEVLTAKSHYLTSKHAKKLGYVFDPDRVRVEFLKKDPLIVLKK